jgi:DNA polymerase-1
MSQKLFIFDVSNIFYRAFYGNDALTTSYGMPVGGLHGFVKTVQGIMRDGKPDLIAFALEGEGESLRKNIDPEYKGNRSEPPEELLAQKKMLPELLAALKYPMFSAAGYEADDAIATLTDLAVDQDLAVTIVSSDKDFSQLIDDELKVRMFNVSKNELVTEKGVYERYGVTTHQFRDYLAIVGDASDNIKGVKGIGEKGAAELIKMYGSLDNIYANLQFIKGAKKDKLIASREEVYKAQKLISFMKIQDAHVDLRAVCSYAGPDVDVARALFKRLEFRELETTLLPAPQTVVMGGVELGVRK